MPTIDQIRAARALLNWSQTDLAERAGLSQTGIARIESGVNQPNTSTLDKIQQAFDDAGIEFIADRGVEKRRSEIRIYRGFDGFADFRRDIVSVARSGPTTICVSNVDESQFDKWGAGAANDYYKNEIIKLDTLSFRILVKEGDTNIKPFRNNTYRWLPKTTFGEISFFIYGNKTAIISFEDEDFNAFVISHEKITRFYMKEFNRLWDMSKEVQI